METTFNRVTRLPTTRSPNLSLLDLEFMLVLETLDQVEWERYRLELRLRPSWDPTLILWYGIRE